MPKLTAAMEKRLLLMREADSDRERFKLLEPLLWLSRMPHRAPRHAMLIAGVLDFLHQIADIHVPDLEQPDYRLIYRSKGDAINCIGNLFDSMDLEEWEQFVPSGVVDTLRQILTNDDLPLTLRSQAGDVMARHGAASDKHEGKSRDADTGPTDQTPRTETREGQTFDFACGIPTSEGVARYERRTLQVSCYAKHPAPCKRITRTSPRRSNLPTSLKAAGLPRIIDVPFAHEVGHQSLLRVPRFLKQRPQHSPESSNLRSIWPLITLPLPRLLTVVTLTAGNPSVTSAISATTWPPFIETPTPLDLRCPARQTVSVPGPPRRGSGAIPAAVDGWPVLAMHAIAVKKSK